LRITGIILLSWIRMFLRLLNRTPIASMSCKHSRKGVFVGTTWNVMVLSGVGTYTTPLTVAVPLLNLIVLLPAAAVSS
jgi:hypothetical protein